MIVNHFLADSDIRTAIQLCGMLRESSPGTIHAFYESERNAQWMYPKTLIEIASTNADFYYFELRIISDRRLKWYSKNRFGRRMVTYGSEQNQMVKIWRGSFYSLCVGLACKQAEASTVLGALILYINQSKYTVGLASCVFEALQYSGYMEEYKEAYLKLPPRHDRPSNRWGNHVSSNSVVLDNA